MVIPPFSGWSPNYHKPQKWLEPGGIRSRHYHFQFLKSSPKMVMTATIASSVVSRGGTIIPRPKKSKKNF